MGLLRKTSCLLGGAFDGVGDTQAFGYAVGCGYRRSGGEMVAAVYHS
jgi:hypothetical protein